ncbi:hypothetical protein HAX54_050981, partial [Datura stramonium]|nr:hypothetical protein [Datura stramonium]
LQKIRNHEAPIPIHDQQQFPPIQSKNPKDPNPPSYASTINKAANPQAIGPKQAKEKVTATQSTHKGIPTVIFKELFPVKESAKIGVYDNYNVFLDFTKEVDFNIVWFKRVIEIEGMQMWLQRWSPNFKLDEDIPIAPIVSSTGTPLTLDTATNGRTRPSMAKDKDQYESETNGNQGNVNDEKNHNNECEADGNLSVESVDSKGNSEGKRKLESIREDSSSEKIENTCQSTNKQDHNSAGHQQNKDKVWEINNIDTYTSLATDIKNTEGVQLVVDIDLDQNRGQEIEPHDHIINASDNQIEKVENTCSSTKRDDNVESYQTL